MDAAAAGQVIHFAAPRLLAPMPIRDSKHGMQRHPSSRPSSPWRGDPVPPCLRDWLQALRPCFTAPSWEHVLVLVMGAVLAPGKRTVTACLRMTGRAEAGNFASCHQILNRARWDPHAVARRLLLLLVERLVPDGPVVLGMDDTIERRWGRRIAARGIYRDPVRSSHGHVVKASGLRWLSFMLLTPLPWTGLTKALPVLTLLAPSERAARLSGHRHKLLTDWARQGILQLCRWLPGRESVFVGDSSFAAHEIAHAVNGRATLISRLRLDANLFAPPPPRHAQAFFSTNTKLDPAEIIALFVRRWQIEVTFAETRAHLGVETQRQWSDKAIARTTPALLGLYSLIALWACDLLGPTSTPYGAAWYQKQRLTFTDAIAAVRFALWVGDIYRHSPNHRENPEISPDRLKRMAEALCFAAQRTKSSLDGEDGVDAALP